MCDYSLHAIASRPAKVGDAIVSTSFRGTLTRGFAAEGEAGCCRVPSPWHRTRLRPGHQIRSQLDFDMGVQVARFCAVEPNTPDQHHDALMFPDGNTVLVTLLSEGQRARVLQLTVKIQEREADHKAEAVVSEIARGDRFLDFCS